MFTISVSSVKGGVGKSTITQNLAVTLAHKGYTVCIADVDTNQSCSRWSELRSEDFPPIPVMGFTDGKNLSNSIRSIKEQYEIVLIDGTPSLSQTASKVIILADLLIIPVLSGAMDLWATEQFIERYDDAVERKEQDIPAYFLLNQFNGRYAIGKETKEVLKDSHIKTLDTTLSNRLAYREANIQGKGVYEYKNAKAIDEIVRLTEEIENIITKS